MNQMDLTDIYRTFHSNTKEYTFSSAPHGKFSNIDHILSKKANFHRNHPYVLSDQHGLKLEFNNNSTLRKPTNTWKLDSKLLNHPWVKKEIKKINHFLEFDKSEGTTYPNL